MSKEQLRAATILFITLFLVMVGFGIIIPIMPFFIETLGGGAVELGLFTAAYSLMQFLFAPAWGRLSDRIGRRPVILVGLFGYGLTFILFGFANQLWMIFAIRILSGIISSATLPTAMAYMADITKGEQRSKAMGLLGAAMGVGMIFGPALGGWLGHFSYSLPFFAAGGLAIVIVPFAMIFLPESLKILGQQSPAEDATKLNLEIIHHPLFTLFVITLVTNFAMAMFQSTFAYYGADKVGLGPASMGTLFAILGVIGVIIQGGVMGKLVERFGDVTLIKAGTIISAVGLLTILLAPNMLLLFVTTAIFNIGSTLVGPTSSSLVSQNSTGGQGAALGLMQSFGSLGRILGPIVGGVLYDLNHVIPFSLGAMLMIIIIIITGGRLSQYKTAQA